MVVVFSFLCRNTEKDKEAGELIDGEDEVELGVDEDYLHSVKVCSSDEKEEKRKCVCCRKNLHLYVDLIVEPIVCIARK